MSQNLNPSLNTMQQLTTSIINEIQAQIADNSDVSVFLLIEGARLLKHKSSQYFGIDSRLGTSLALDDSGHDAHSASPLLFDLDVSAWTSPYKATQLDALFKNDIASVLISPLPKSILKTHLAHHLDMTMSDDTEMLMRFFDPRVLPFWFDMLPSSHRADIVGGVHAWGYLNHRQQFTWLSLNSSDEQTDTAQFPLVTTARQENDLMRHCLPYTLLDRLLPDVTSRLSELPYPNDIPA